MQLIYLLSGSNLGDRELFLNKAADEIEQRIGKITARSSFYQTASWGKENQPDFLNQVLCVSSDLSAREVLTAVLAIETELGRERIEKWGSRVIDIDILFYGNEIINEPDLIVPHPYFQERRFAVEPMLELAPDYLHPILKKTIKSIALELTDNLFVQKTKSIYSNGRRK